MSVLPIHANVRVGSALEELLRELKGGDVAGD
jgi:hypothetical protein